MKTTRLLASLFCAAGAPALAAQSIVFNTGTLVYDNSDTVLVSSANLMAENGTNIFLRDPRAVMQTFQVSEPIELAAVNTIIRRAVANAAFTLTLRNFGATPPGGSVSPGVVSSTPALASISHTVTAEQGFGAPGPVTAADPATTLTWVLGGSVMLVPGNHYAFVFDGTGTVNAEHVIAQYNRSNAYAGGLGYYQDGNASNFLSGSGIFGATFDDQVDFGLGLVAVPEPSTYAAAAGLAALGLVLLRRRRFTSK
ncbi:MAG: PEP-CTERM sorting domain-containing protein [Opitutales bacterium]|nr:PEP-CTERM sorting domain-containing protein [Opitutales bacterium]